MQHARFYSSGNAAWNARVCAVLSWGVMHCEGHAWLCSLCLPCWRPTSLAQLERHYVMGGVALGHEHLPLSARALERPAVCGRQWQWQRRWQVSGVGGGFAAAGT